MLEKLNRDMEGIKNLNSRGKNDSVWDEKQTKNYGWD